MELEGYELRYNPNWAPGEYPPPEAIEVFRTREAALARAKETNSQMWSIWHYRTGAGAFCTDASCRT